ncbi:phage tail tape measure protein, TP901 family [Methylocella silvestris BL2]|uniref:Phage tail tape measure protein, TP901 family n=1 Tax=Methylocella silvestris (strain DSM 15510 / CIP 108128 / LMG 27833 / NCIMB 13906 / BL2) TaxID=395965 RepID=B8EHZ6_METSB|nr:phage tail tape measure protein [Methylocella silvestris]ACK50478.1 phage tail tape measure protein, TP901 family [Methylocella silvestris BL2]
MSSQMEARLIISAEDRTSGVFRAIEERVMRLNAAASAISSTASRVAAMQSYLPGARSGASTLLAAGAAGSRNGAAAIPKAPPAPRGHSVPAVVAGSGLSLPQIVGAGAAALVAKEAVGNFAELEDRVTSLGITAEATDGQIKGAMKSFREFGPQYGVTASTISEAAEKYVAAGIDFNQAIAGTPAAIKAAKASGASLDDVVNSGIASIQNLGIHAEKLDRAFDIMAKGGKLGSFELKNMARELPAVASRAKALGLTGETGLTKLVAMLETTRKTSATGEEAANNLLNLLDKITSADTTKSFKKKSVDLEKVLKDGAKHGVDYVTTMLGLVEKMTAGDPFKIAALFPDRQAREGIMALLKFKDFYQDTVAEINATAIGTNTADLDRRLETTKSKVDRLGAAWDVFTGRLGEAIAPALTPMIEQATKLLAELEKAIGNAPTAGSGQKKFNRLANFLVDGVSSDRSRGDTLVQRNEVDYEAKAAELQRKAEGRDGAAHRAEDARKAYNDWTGAPHHFWDDVTGGKELKLRVQKESAERDASEGAAAQRQLDELNAARDARRGAQARIVKFQRNLPPNMEMRRPLEGAPGPVPGGSFSLDHSFKNFDPATGYPTRPPALPQVTRLRRHR